MVGHLTDEQVFLLLNTIARECVAEDDDVEGIQEGWLELVGMGHLIGLPVEWTCQALLDWFVDSISHYLQSTSTLAAAPLRHPFERKVDAIKPSKQDINAVIMDYLVCEGFPDAARSFAKEANIPAEAQEGEPIQARVDVKRAIHAGNIQQAIEMINELNPEILDLNHALHFALLRLQLIELIRFSRTSNNEEDIIIAINFARDHLAPRASVNQQFKHDLEQAMSLVAFAPEKLTPELKALLEPKLKQDVAEMVNQAILTSYGRNNQARIKALIKLRAWAETKARDSGKEGLPPMLSIGVDENPQNGASQDTAMHENGQASLEGDAMVP